jgi:hypothetical protein
MTRNSANRAIAVSMSSWPPAALLVAAYCYESEIRAGSGDLLGPFAPEMAGRRLTSTPPSWLETEGARSRLLPREPADYSGPY